MHRKTSRIKCPKCGSNNFSLNELHEGITTRGFVDGKWDRESVDNPSGPIGKVIAKCNNRDCRHSWTLKNVLTFADLECDEWLDDQSPELMTSSPIRPEYW